MPVNYAWHVRPHASRATTERVNATAGWNSLLLCMDIVWGDVVFGLRLNAPPGVLWALKVTNQPPANLVPRHDDSREKAPEAPD